MRAKITLNAGHREITEFAEIERPGDLDFVVKAVFDKARTEGFDMWNVLLQVSKA